MKNFNLIGAAGYIAPRHMQAIVENGSKLIASYDISDSVGIIDRYAPQSHFFTNFKEYVDFIGKFIESGKSIDYTSICSPNHLHFEHIVHGLKIGSNVICEKPLVLDSSDIDELKLLEKKYNRKIYTLLQLRHHRSILDLKDKINKSKKNSFEVDLTYITSRGNWYHKSWKGDEKISGGIATNIGIHFFDMLSFVFGDLIQNELHFKDETTMAGYLELEKARIRWMLSIDEKNLPDGLPNAQKTYRSITVNGDEVEFSDGFTDLHTESYKSILSGKGFGLDEAKKSIKIVEDLRHMPIMKNMFNEHPGIKRTR